MLFITVRTRREGGLHSPLINEEMKYKSTRKIFTIENKLKRQSSKPFLYLFLRLLQSLTLVPRSSIRGSESAATIPIY